MLTPSIYFENVQIEIPKNLFDVSAYLYHAKSEFTKIVTPTTSELTKIAFAQKQVSDLISCQKNSVGKYIVNLHDCRSNQYHAFYNNSTP